MADAKKAAGKAAPSKGAAARSEAKKESKTIDFRGLNLVFPSKTPLSLVLRYRQMKRESRQDETMLVLGLLELFLGQDQFDAIITKCDEDGLTIEDDLDVLAELVNDVEELLGTGSGESSASANS